MDVVGDEAASVPELLVTAVPGSDWPEPPQAARRGMAQATRRATRRRPQDVAGDAPIRGPSCVNTDAATPLTTPDTRHSDPSMLGRQLARQQNFSSLPEGRASNQAIRARVDIALERETPHTCEESVERSTTNLKWMLIMQ